MSETNALAIRHNPAANRFEATVDGLLCQAAYQLSEQAGSTVMTIHHTGVPAALEGRGIAAQLVQAALGHARAQGLKVRPTCSYVAAYMRRHPEWADVRVA
jgi:predicted GNAT family acetyltransferase